MIIERNSEEVIIRLPASVNTDDLQDFIDYARYKELTSKSTATQRDVDELLRKLIRIGGQVIEGALFNLLQLVMH